jgi:hypothetical protein
VHEESKSVNQTPRKEIVQETEDRETPDTLQRNLVDDADVGQPKETANFPMLGERDPDDKPVELEEGELEQVLDVTNPEAK